MCSTLLALVLAVVSPAAPPAVPAPPGELRGQVLGRKGAPLPRFTVNGIAFESLEGRFKILTPPQGEFRVVVRADGYAPNVFHVQGASGKKLQIPRSGSGPASTCSGRCSTPRRRCRWRRRASRSAIRRSWSGSAS